MVRLHCLGGGLEVGRNAFLLESKTNLMLDYGMHVEDGAAPLKPPTKVDALFISHGHLDHFGFSPGLHKTTHCKVYGTAPTYDFANLLLRDSLKIAQIKQRPLHFGPGDIMAMNKDFTKIHYGDEIKIGDMKIETWDAGHLPGSCIFVVTVAGKKIMYTGDFNAADVRLIRGARYDVKDIDTVIMENTYSSRDHPPRAEQEKEMVKVIKATCESGGIALLPTFSYRAPELLMILHHYGINFPVYLDGMAKDATSISLEYPEYIRDHKALRAATENAIPLFATEERNNAMKEPGVIVTTGGAMEGGPIVHYMKQLYGKENCSLIFTGYQIPKTASRYLSDTGRFVLGAIDFKVKMPIHRFDFSSHAGRDELMKFLQKVRPEKAVMIHGDYCEKFATEMKGRFGIQTYAPKIGDVIKL